MMFAQGLHSQGKRDSPREVMGKVSIVDFSRTFSHSDELPTNFIVPFFKEYVVKNRQVFGFGGSGVTNL